jgi:hypothetical protein
MGVLPRRTRTAGQCESGKGCMNMYVSSRVISLCAAPRGFHRRYVIMVLPRVRRVARAFIARRLTTNPRRGRDLLFKFDFILGDAVRVLYTQQLEVRDHVYSQPITKPLGLTSSPSTSQRRWLAPRPPGICSRHIVLSLAEVMAYGHTAVMGRPAGTVGAIGPADESALNTLSSDSMTFPLILSTPFIGTYRCSADHMYFATSAKFRRSSVLMPFDPR